MCLKYYLKTFCSMHLFVILSRSQVHALLSRIFARKVSKRDWKACRKIIDFGSSTRVSFVKFFRSQVRHRISDNLSYFVFNSVVTQHFFNTESLKYFLFLFLFLRPMRFITRAQFCDACDKTSLNRFFFCGNKFNDTDNY